MDRALPELDSSHPLTDAQVAAFRRDGHVHLPAVFSPEEVAAYREVIVRAANAAFESLPPLEEREFGDAFLQTLNLRLRDDGVRAFVLARRFGKIAAELAGVEATRIYHDQALFKEPGGSITAWHQDQYYWPVATDHAMGMWMPLLDVSLDMGPVRFASGSHVHGFLGQHAISDDSQRVYEDYVRERGYPVWQKPIAAGDATFHSGWTIHGATANRSAVTREAMIVTFYPDGSRVDELHNASRVGDAKTYLGGRTEGELADSELNTVVYRRS